MKYRLYLSAALMVLSLVSISMRANEHTKSLISSYDVSWKSQSSGPDGSMPCGGYDTGINVWTENGDILLYFSKSDFFDENNALLKGGRLRLSFSGNPFGAEDFEQVLKLYDGYVVISGGGTTVTVWADTGKSVFHIDVNSVLPIEMKASYESWRHTNRLVGDEKNATSWKWIAPKNLEFKADIIENDNSSLTFRHENGQETIFDYSVKDQGLEQYKSQMFNPIAKLIWGGRIDFAGMTFVGSSQGTYINTPFKSWTYKSTAPSTHYSLTCAMASVQAEERQWRSALGRIFSQIIPSSDREASIRWWNDYWDRSYIVIDASHKGSEAWKIGRNYQLFRYMLGCNAYGSYPTKFNGGLFTFDGKFVNPKMPFSPDFRNWAGGTMTAQNQRLVYFPMLKTGDFELMKPQFDFYLNSLCNAELRSKHYWGHGGACFTEQLENYGLPNPAEYGQNRPKDMDPGMQKNNWLEYQWDSSLEFCLMILETHRYSGMDISEYLPLIGSCLEFFENHYRYLSQKRGENELDSEGHLVLYPGSACETYKMARNSSSTISALQAVSKELIDYYEDTEGTTSVSYKRWKAFSQLIPEIPYRMLDGKQCIAPAESWERINNEETPQLYPVFPWRIIRPGDSRMQYAINTYFTDPDALRFRSHKGWKQDAIWAACLGLTDEASRLILAKLSDGPHRFPAFWGPGFDWTPDHNHGGSGAIALQEMLLSEDSDGNMITKNAWPEDWEVEYRLYGPNGQVYTNAAEGKTSVAGFFPLEDSGRIVLSFNQDWRYHKGDVEGAADPKFDDSAWESVCTPHSVELLAAEGSGSRNYQGPAWYRKRFVLPSSMSGHEATLHFEAVMGKQVVYVNGSIVSTHLGGYLPFEINLSSCGVKPGDECLVAVMADNSNDKSYPPGKPQYTLDFTYHGGIYRDVWLIGKAPVHITDAVSANKTAGGGVFVHYEDIREDSAVMTVQTDIESHSAKTVTIGIKTTVKAPDGQVVAEKITRQSIAPAKGKTVVQKFTLARPELWSLEKPSLYTIESRIMEGRNCIDGGITHSGIRKIEFLPDKGIFLNGKALGQLIGTNRHQDFAYVGNALPNNLQRADAQKIHDAGFRIIRSAHYPQDPSFMDACDELGIFIIVATPGWQFWNKDASFAELVHGNTRAMIRRDRNHPSVILWEPILNETDFPLEFSLEALSITREEYPFEGAPGAAADLNSKGVKENYDVVYGWPWDAGKASQCIFTREFGEFVDDWYAHNCTNRAARSWGETPMLVAANSLLGSLKSMYQTNGQFIGGAQWHSFDHQRGYHPDPYWGGDWDAFRQEKYAYYMFKAALEQGDDSTEPFIFFAGEMTPFSPSDLTIYSNCDSVRVRFSSGEIHYPSRSTSLTSRSNASISSSRGSFVFDNIWDMQQVHNLTYTQKKWQNVVFTAEGFRDGKIVCTASKMPSRRSTKLTLRLDPTSGPLEADGSSFVTVIAEVTDDTGNIRRLAKESVVFEVEGEGSIIGDESIGANPRILEFGSAPVLIRSTPSPGKIIVKAHVQFEGILAPTPASIEFYSIAPEIDFCSGINTMNTATQAVEKSQDRKSEANVQRLNPEEAERLLRQVEEQQTKYGISN